MLTLVFPLSLRDQLIAEARAVLPMECCGLIEGVRDGADVRARALHRTANIADDPVSGFLIDPAAHLRLSRTLRGSGREIVGCYHSHPGGRARPSERDRAQGGQEGFVWIIAGLKRNPEKCEAVFRKIARKNKNLEQNRDSTIADFALGDEVSLAAFEGPDFRAIEMKA